LLQEQALAPTCPRPLPHKHHTHTVTHSDSQHTHVQAPAPTRNTLSPLNLPSWTSAPGSQILGRSVGFTAAGAGAQLLTLWTETLTSSRPMGLRETGEAGLGVEDEEGSSAHTGHTLNAAVSSPSTDVKTPSTSLIHQGKQYVHWAFCWRQEYGCLSFFIVIVCVGFWPASFFDSMWRCMRTYLNIQSCRPYRLVGTHGVVPHQSRRLWD
jgi:hypothetical protein